MLRIFLLFFDLSCFFTKQTFFFGNDLTIFYTKGSKDGDYIYICEARQ